MSRSGSGRASEFGQIPLQAATDQRPLNWLPSETRRAGRGIVDGCEVGRARTARLAGFASALGSRTTGTFVLFAFKPADAKLPSMIEPGARPKTGGENQGQRLFYGLFLPLGVLTNLALGVLILTGLNPVSWSGWLQIGTGGLCCLIAGWLAAAAWSRFYWYRSMSRQVATWRRIADAFFAWVEEAPVPAESLRSLKTSLEEAVPSTESR